MRIILAIPIFIILTTASAFAARERGEVVFMTYKCNACHSVSTANIKAELTLRFPAPDLVNATLRHNDREWLIKYLRQKTGHQPCLKTDISRDGKNHHKLFTGSKKEEIALLDWLDKQRKQETEEDKKNDRKKDDWKKEP